MGLTPITRLRYLVLDAEICARREQGSDYPRIALLEGIVTKINCWQQNHEATVSICGQKHSQRSLTGVVGGIWGALADGTFGIHRLPQEDGGAGEEELHHVTVAAADGAMEGRVAAPVPEIRLHVVQLEEALCNLEREPQNRRIKRANGRESQLGIGATNISSPPLAVHNGV